MVGTDIQTLDPKAETLVEKAAVATCERLASVKIKMFEVCAIASKVYKAVGKAGMVRYAELLHEHGGHRLSWRRLVFTYARVYDEWHDKLTPEQMAQANISTLEKLLRGENIPQRKRLLAQSLEEGWSPQRIEQELKEESDGRPPVGVAFQVIPADDQVGRCHDALTQLEVKGLVKSIRRVKS